MDQLVRAGDKDNDALIGVQRVDLMVGLASAAEALRA
ncbi:hypothetical protein SAMN04489731_1042 [Amycolatopsis regifaucium]|nr:hypothetical protein SAMN04489731_1042 [Amycolatopsis regifaucium]